MELLREAADAIHVYRISQRTLQAPERAKEGRSKLFDLADRIEALLPPREET